MPLFSENPLRSAATAAVIVSAAHYSTKLLSSLHSFQLAQTVIAVLATGALLFMIMLHHRNEGQVMMTQAQEEMAVIGILALFWVVFLVGYKSFRGTTTTGAGTEIATPSRDPCLQDGVRCVYEEYYYW